MNSKIFLKTIWIEIKNKKRDKLIDFIKILF